MEDKLESVERFVGEQFAGGELGMKKFSSDCVVFYNKAWRSLGMKKNMKFLGQEFGGPVVITGTGQWGPITGLTEDQAQRIMLLIK